MQRIPIVLVGAGRMGQIRAPLLSSHTALSLRGCVDTAPPAVQALLGGSVPHFDSLSEAFASSDDAASEKKAVWIGTPTHTHVSLIEEAADLGCDIFVEKPVSASIEQIHHCYDVARARGVSLVCGFQRRLDPSYKAVSDEVRGGKLGRVHSIHTVFRDHPTPPLEFLITGGDPFTDLAPHDVDYIRHLVGEEPSEVYSIGSAFQPELAAAGVLDSCHMVLSFPSGAVATLEMTRSTTYGYDQRAEVFCDEGMAQVGNVPTTNAVITTSIGETSAKPHYSFPERFPEAYVAEVEHFVQVVKGNEEPVVTELDCIQAQRIALAGLESYETKKPVKLMPYKRT